MQWNHVIGHKRTLVSQWGIKNFFLRNFISISGVVFRCVLEWQYLFHFVWQMIVCSATLHSIEVKKLAVSTFLFFSFNLPLSFTWKFFLFQFSSYRSYNFRLMKKLIFPPSFCTYPHLDNKLLNIKCTRALPLTAFFGRYWASIFPKCLHLSTSSWRF